MIFFSFVHVRTVFTTLVISLLSFFLYFVVLPMHLLTIILLASFFVGLVRSTLSIHAFHHAFTFHHAGINYYSVITRRCKEDF